MTDRPTESVWDYPRPPSCLSSDRLVTVHSEAGELIASTRQAWRVLETSHPPTWYVPPSSVMPGILTLSTTRPTVCEWKGLATYWDVLTDGDMVRAGAWSYQEPTEGFVTIAGYLAFSPSKLVCAVDGERATPQDGGFYGGWITTDVTGPFKGAPGTLDW